MLIGLCGKPGSGKTEVRNILVNQHKFDLICSKSILYRMSSMVTGLNEEEFYLQSEKNKQFKGLTHRQITGRLGNAIEDMFGDSYLVNRAIQECYTKGFCYVVDSLRKNQTVDFPGFVVEIISPLSQNTGNSFDLYNREPITHQLFNGGSLEQLTLQVNELVKELWTTFPQEH